MRKAIKKGIIAIAVLMAFNTLAVSETRAQGILRDILKRMDNHHKALQSLRSDVTMAKYNAQLDENDVFQGSTSYLPKTGKNNMYVRIDWVKPLEENIVVIGGTYKLYRPRLNQVITGKVDKAKNSGAAGGALAFMSMSKEQLNANYTVRFIAEETLSGGVKAWHLELTPKAVTSYKTAELWVDGDGMPRQAKIIERNNDSTTVLLSNLQKNIRINADIFDLKYDRKKVKEIRG